jgi:hypothetical protein
MCTASQLPRTPTRGRPPTHHHHSPTRPLAHPPTPPHTTRMESGLRKTVAFSLPSSGWRVLACARSRNEQNWKCISEKRLHFPYRKTVAFSLPKTGSAPFDINTPDLFPTVIAQPFFGSVFATVFREVNSVQSRMPCPRPTTPPPPRPPPPPPAHPPHTPPPPHPPARSPARQPARSPRLQPRPHTRSPARRPARRPPDCRDARPCPNAAPREAHRSADRP